MVLVGAGQLGEDAPINAWEVAGSQVPDVRFVPGAAASFNLGCTCGGEMKETEDEGPGRELQLGMWLVLRHEDVVSRLELQVLGTICSAPGVSVAEGVTVLGDSQMVS